MTILSNFSKNCLWMAELQVILIFFITMLVYDEHVLLLIIIKLLSVI